jgi:hypothetical protein
MVDHQEILSAVAIVRHGSRTDDIQEFDRQSPRRSNAILFEGALRVRETDDGVVCATGLPKYSMLEIGWNIIRDAELRGDAPVALAC